MKPKNEEKENPNKNKDKLLIQEINNINNIVDVKQFLKRLVRGE